MSIEASQARPGEMLHEQKLPSIHLSLSFCEDRGPWETLKERREGAIGLATRVGWSHGQVWQ